MRIWFALAGGAAFAAVGFVYAARLRKRWRGLEAAARAVRLLQGPVTLLDAPLSLAVHEGAPDDAFLARWAESSLEAACASVGLRAEDVTLLRQWERAVETGSRGNEAPFTHCLALLEREADEARAHCQKEGTLYRKLGLLAGAAAFTLAI